MPIRLDAHRPEFHRGAPPQLPVRAATTANITISTALNNGDSLDGLTLATGDRVLVKDQSTGAQNGIYIVGATPARSFDMSEGVAAWGALVYVIAGTANGGKFFRNTNATLPTIGTTALTWADYTPGGISATIIDAKGDLIAGTAADTAARLAVGSNDTILMADSAQTTGLKWVASQTPSTQAFSDSPTEGTADTYARGDHKHGMPAGSSGLTIQDEGSPLTTDATTLDFVGAGVTASGTGATKTITVAGGTGVTIQDEGSPLTTAADTLNFVGSGVAATGTGTTKTITISGGGSGYTPYGLDYPEVNGTLDGTYGDAFTGGSLNGRWSRHNQTSGQETYAQGASASSLKVAHGTTNVAEYIYQTAPNGTNETWEASVSWFQETTTNQMFALLMVNSSGTGVAVIVYDNTGGVYLANVASHIYSSSVTALTTLKPTTTYYQSGGRIWIRLRKASGVYAASYSLDGEIYSREASGTPSAFTPARVGVGRILGTNANSIAYWHWFNKTA